MIAPSPSAVRSTTPTARRSSVSLSPVSATSASIGFLAHIPDGCDVLAIPTLRSLAWCTARRSREMERDSTPPMCRL
jgi:hypothetical protein